MDTLNPLLSLQGKLLAALPDVLSGVSRPTIDPGIWTLTARWRHAILMAEWNPSGGTIEVFTPGDSAPGRLPPQTFHTPEDAAAFMGKFFDGEARQPATVVYTLAELRDIAGISQEAVAAFLGVGQAAVSKRERSADPLLRTVREHVEAVGGTLEVAAVVRGRRFPLVHADDGVVAHPGTTHLANVPVNLVSGLEETAEGRRFLGLCASVDTLVNVDEAEGAADCLSRSLYAALNVGERHRAPARATYSLILGHALDRARDRKPLEKALRAGIEKIAPFAAMDARGLRDATLHAIDRTAGDLSFALDVDEAYWKNAAYPTDHEVRVTYREQLTTLRHLVRQESGADFSLPLGRAVRMNASPYTEFALQCVLNLLLAPDDPNADSQLVFSYVDWDLAPHFFREGELDVLFQNGDVAQDLRRGTMMSDAPLFVYYGYELVLAKHRWHALPEEHQRALNRVGEDGAVLRLAESAVLEHPPAIDALRELLREARVACLHTREFRDRLGRFTERRLKMPKAAGPKLEYVHGGLGLTRFLRGDVDALLAGNNDALYLCQHFPSRVGCRVSFEDENPQLTAVAAGPHSERRTIRAADSSGLSEVYFYWPSRPTEELKRTRHIIECAWPWALRVWLGLSGIDTPYLVDPAGELVRQFLAEPRNDSFRRDVQAFLVGEFNRRLVKGNDGVHGAFVDSFGTMREVLQGHNAFGLVRGQADTEPKTTLGFGTHSLISPHRNRSRRPQS